MFGYRVMAKKRDIFIFPSLCEKHSTGLETQYIAVVLLMFHVSMTSCTTVTSVAAADGPGPLSILPNVNHSTTVSSLHWRHLHTNLLFLDKRPPRNMT